MKKEVYSLVLSENVVAAVDRMAKERGANRSALINQILAEYVSYVTPEMRMKNTLALAGEQLRAQAAFRVGEQASPAILRTVSSLDYKYNPDVHYRVELYREAKGYLGELKVWLRTQNSGLLLYMNGFYRLWSENESANMPGRSCAVDGGRFVRKLENPQGGEAGRLISAYVTGFDAALKAYFGAIGASADAASAVKNAYGKYILGRGVTL